MVQLHGLDGAAPVTPRTVSLGPLPLTTDTLKRAASYFEVELQLPHKMVVPKGAMQHAARLLHYHYGDLAIGIRMEWQGVSDSWALVSPTLVVMSVWKR